jgi:hypothetical protein
MHPLFGSRKPSRSPILPLRRIPLSKNQVFVEHSLEPIRPNRIKGLRTLSETAF